MLWVALTLLRTKKSGAPGLGFLTSSASACDNPKHISTHSKLNRRWTHPVISHDVVTQHSVSRSRRLEPRKVLVLLANDEDDWDLVLVAVDEGFDSR